MKLLILGLDGLSPEVWREFFDPEGEFDTYDLTSSIPISGPAWTSIYTGLTPEQHRVYHPWGRDDKDYQTHRDVRQHAFWNILYANGISIDAVGMPITWPASPVRPRFISGFWQGDESYWYYPTEKFPGDGFKAICDPIWWVSSVPESCPGWMERMYVAITPEEFLHDLLWAVKAYSAFYISTCEKCDVGMLGYTHLDRVLHVYYQHLEPAAQAIAHAVRGAIATLEPEMVLACSDHGFEERAEHPGQGGHTNTGVLALRGFPEQERTEWHTWDVAPLVLSVFGQEAHSQPGEYTVREYEELLDRLKKLGYIG